MMYIEGAVDFYFKDTFTDIRSIRKNKIGTSDPAAASPDLMDETEYLGIYYDITDKWQSRFSAEAKRNEGISKYVWD